MKVLRIVPNLGTPRVAEARRFYGDFLGLKTVMDLDWIVTYASAETTKPQISIASEGGSGTVVPDISVEVDDLDETLARAKQFGFEPEYGPVTEPWGVRRFYVRDPAGRLVNIVSHQR